jgi:hypothetical protein
MSAEFSKALDPADALGMVVRLEAAPAARHKAGFQPELLGPAGKRVLVDTGLDEKPVPADPTVWRRAGKRAGPGHEEVQFFPWYVETGAYARIRPLQFVGSDR